MNYFIDTNSLIHYRLFNDIDWNNELDDKDEENDRTDSNQR